MDHPSAPGKTAWIAADRKPLHPLCPCLATDAARATQPREVTAPPAARSLAHRRRGSLPMPAGRYEVLAPTGTHPGGRDPLQCAPRICTGNPTPSVRALRS